MGDGNGKRGADLSRDEGSVDIFEIRAGWGSICRKIDWTGVAFALVLLASIVRLSSTEEGTKRTARDTPEKFQSSLPLMRKRRRNAISTLFFLSKTFIFQRLLSRQLWSKNIMCD